MANTISIAALRKELWSKVLFDDVMRDVTNAMGFAGESSNNVFQIKRELKKEKGDTQTFGLVTRLSGDGVVGDAELEGNEEAMNSFDEQVSIDQIRNAVRLKGKLDSQKVVYDQIEQARANLRIWMKEFIIRQFFFKLGGVTNTLLVDTAGNTIGGRATWSNTSDFIADADTSDGLGLRYLRANRSGAGDGTDDLVAADTMTLDEITNLATMAKLAQPQIQPLERDGESFYVLFVHPYQARDLRKSSDWKTAQQDAQRRGEKNPVFKGALGFWSGVLIVENEFVPWLDISSGAGNSFRGAAVGTNAAVDMARALLCGRQAVLYAEASNPDALVVEGFDYKNKEGVAASLIGGFQKTMFDSKEFGVIAMDSAAAA